MKGLCGVCAGGDVVTVDSQMANIETVRGEIA